MGIRLICYLLVLYGVFKSTKSSQNLSYTNGMHKWGTYYRLPAQLAEVEKLFSKFQEDLTNITEECVNSTAQLVNWYQSFTDPDLLLLSYDCPDFQGHHHRYYFITKKSGKLAWEPKDSLSDYGIVDVGKYEKEIPNPNFMLELLNSVREKIALQVDSKTQEELCRDPGLNTSLSFETKRENELYYYK